MFAVPEGRGIVSAPLDAPVGSARAPEAPGTEEAPELAKGGG